MKKVLLIVLSLWLIACPAMAMRVEYEGGGILTCAQAPGAQEQTVGASRIDILGRTQDGLYLVAADGVAYYAREEALREALEDKADLSTVPSLSETAAVKKGSRGEAVKALQSALVALGYLNDVADGSYGNNTVVAVKAFQQERLPASLSEDGEADAATQYLARSLTDQSEAQLRLSGVPLTPELKYPEIAGRLEDDLSGFCSGEYALRYDDMADEGYISMDQAAVWQMEVTAEIDRISLELRFGLRVESAQDGKLRAVPMMEIRSQGSRRPYVQGGILRIGDVRYDITAQDSEGEVLGRDVAESAMIALNAEGLAMLREFAARGEADLRIQGKYRQFDVKLQAADFPALDNFANSALLAGLAADNDAVTKRA